MTDVKIYLKSKRKPIVFTFESTEQIANLLRSIDTKRFTSVGYITIATDDISHIIFEKSK